MFSAFCVSEQGVGGLDGSVGLPALQPCTLSLYVLCGWRGAWVPVYSVYRVLCHLVQYVCPIGLPLINGL